MRQNKVEETKVRPAALALALLMTVAMLFHAEAQTASPERAEVIIREAAKQVHARSTDDISFLAGALASDLDQITKEREERRARSKDRSLAPRIDFNNNQLAEGVIKKSTEELAEKVSAEWKPDTPVFKCYADWGSCKSYNQWYVCAPALWLCCAQTMFPK